ncbi:MAG TPA: hypothetical protein VNY84_12425, partial [Acidimicrobiales bacterium]|nr:hypothetical protein [Acidimicrobiales bacterium]
DLLGPPLVPSMEIAGGRWKKPAVVGGLAACVALGGFLIANNQGGGHKAPTVAAVAPVSPGNKPASNTAAFPPNTVGDGCLAFTVFSDSTDVHLVANMASVPPGIYHVTMQTDGGPLSGSSTIGDGATFFDVPLHFNRFTNITGAQASGPGGPIDVAALQKLWPFALNQTSEQAKGCSGATLKPIASLAPPVAVTSDPKPLVAPFLSGLAGDFRAGNADDADSKLDPVVLQIHTLAQCRATVSTFTDPTYAFSVTSISDPQPFDYTSGGKTVTVPHVLAVGVVRTRNGQPSGLTVHVSIGADGTLHWFTSCEPGSN